MKNRKLLLGLLLAITFLAFFPSLNNKFTNWDDDHYILNNGVIRELSFQNTAKIFTAKYYKDYLPLTILSYDLEYTFFKLDPFYYHLDNLLLHLFNCLLAFCFIILLCGNNRVAFITALLFALHPLRVESVAWLAERKDVLYAMFYLLSLICYLQYQKFRKNSYLYLALTGFILSCFSKATAVTLPFLLFLLDHYNGRKYDRKAVLEKLPFFIFTLVFGVLAFFMQKAEETVKIEKISGFADNILNALYNLGFYLNKLIAPLELSNVYPYPAALTGMLPLIALLILAVAAIIYYKNKLLNFGALFFLAAIFPMLQLVPFGLGIPADRYTYIPALGLFFLAGTVVEKLYGEYGINEVKRKILTAVIVLVIMLLGALTFIRCFAWYDGETIWKDALKKDNKYWIADYNLAAYYFDKGEYAPALSHFNRTLELDPGSKFAYKQRALTYIRLGEFTKARSDIESMKSYNPKEAENALRLYELCDRLESKVKRGINREEAQAVEDGRTCLAQGNYRGAVVSYTEALVFNPGNPEYLNNKGVALSALNDNLSALKEFDAAIKAMNNDALPEYYYNRGNIFRKLGEHNEAVADYSRAIKKEKGKSEYYNNRGISYFNLKDYKRALDDFEQAVLLNPGNKSAIKNRDMLSRNLKPVNKP